jgi:predicted CXXCH cytochrome family protein
MNAFPIARVSFLALALVAVPAVATGPSASSPAPPPHPTWKLDSCLTCHAPAEKEALGKRLYRPCAPLCATCHDDRESHHPAGVPVRGLRAPLLLTGDGRLICSTCHDVAAPRYRDSDWTSRCLVDRLGLRKGARPTKLLVMKNDRGQLCKSCH